MNKNETTNVMPEEVKKSVFKNNIKHIDHHNCHLCNYMTKYIVIDDNLYFDNGCDCMVTHSLTQRSWSSASDWINMQNIPKIKKKIAKLFGIEL